MFGIAKLSVTSEVWDKVIRLNLTSMILYLILCANTMDLNGQPIRFFDPDHGKPEVLLGIVFLFFFTWGGGGTKNLSS